MKTTIIIKSIIAMSVFPLVASDDVKKNANAEPAPAPAGRDMSGSEAAPSLFQASGTSNPSTKKSTALANSLAFEKKVTASSIYADAYLPKNAVDGDLGSYWSSETKDGAWLAIDLGESKKVGSVTIHWELAYASAFSLQVSTDGQTWIEVYKTNEGKGGISQITFPSAEARHVRLNCTKRGTTWGNAVSEIQIF